MMEGAEMNDVRKLFISPEATIRDALRLIGERSMQLALVVDGQNRLLGTITDGDIRRGLLEDLSLDVTVTEIYHRNPIYGNEWQAPATIRRLMRKHNVRQIPIVDKQGVVVRLELDKSPPRESFTRDNWVVLMAGGLGTRLRPLTENCPKPMLSLGEKPILEHILENFVEQGFENFFISVNYMAEMVEEYFKDGSAWDVHIRYLRESQRLGTAGSLSLLPEPPDSPIIVMNGDLLTTLDFKELLNTHQSKGSVATVCVRTYDMEVPYGVIRTEKEKIVQLDEKPIVSFYINAGVYVLSSEALNIIPCDRFFDMTDLVSLLIATGDKPGTFPIGGYWQDIGQKSDLEKAKQDICQGVRVGKEMGE